MPWFFWLSLVAGFGLGLGAAHALLSRVLAQPLQARLMVAGVALGIAALAFALYTRERRVAAFAGSGAAPAPDPRPSTQGVHAVQAKGGAPHALSSTAASDRRVGDEPSASGVRAPELPREIGANDVRHILYEGQVDVLFRPVVDLAEPGLVCYQAVARLRGADGEVLEPARYLRVAARCGLAGLIDQIFIVRCAQMVRCALEEGHEIRMLCNIAAASLSEEGFTTEIKSFFVGQAELSRRLVLEIERWPQDACGAANLSRLRQAGIQFCLRRLMPGPVDANDLARRGFAYLRLDAPQYATETGEALAHPDLEHLGAALRAAGIGLLVDHAAAERIPADIHVLPGEGTEKRALWRLRSRAA